MLRRRRIGLAAMSQAVDELVLPEAIWKTCPWQPRELIETGLRQWLRCAGAAMGDRQTIGMPSHAVDEAWHGLILCTALYARFCERAYGRFLHHHPEGGTPDQSRVESGSMAEQLGRTVVAWILISRPGERAVLWDLDEHLDVDEKWGVPTERVAAITAALAADAG